MGAETDGPLCPHCTFHSEEKGLPSRVSQTESVLLLGVHLFVPVERCREEVIDRPHGEIKHRGQTRGGGPSSQTGTMLCTQWAEAQMHQVLCLVQGCSGVAQVDDVVDGGRSAVGGGVEVGSAGKSLTGETGRARNCRPAWVMGQDISAQVPSMDSIRD